jgi:hypothetical protein
MKRGELEEERGRKPELARGGRNGCRSEPKLELVLEQRNELEPRNELELELERQRRGTKEHWGCTCP